MSYLAPGMDRYSGERLRRRGLQRSARSARRDRALHSRAVRDRRHALLSHGDHRLARGHGGGAAQSLARQGFAAEGAAMDGFHVEGPHIGIEDGPRGAHPKRWVRKPDFDEFRRWQDATGGRVRIVTLSPEWPEAPRYIERIVARRRGGVDRPHGGERGADRRCRFGGRHAFHALGQRRARGDAAPSELHLGSTGRRPADGRFHRGRHPHGRGSF